MKEKVLIAKNSVQETLLLPLWGRSQFAHAYPTLFSDPEAKDIVNRLDYDFSTSDMTDYAGALYAIRQEKLVEKAKKYLKNHPKATIVNLGCGLDTSFSKADNGSCRWINLDFPNVIRFRQQLLQVSDREENLSCDATDKSWMDEVDDRNGVFVIAGGVFHYFKPDDVLDLISIMAERFPGGGICFDAESTWAMKQSNKLVKKTGNSGAPMYFSIDDEKKFLLPLREKIESVDVEKRPPEKYLRGPVPIKTRIILRLGQITGMLKFVEIRFKSQNEMLATIATPKSPL